MMCIGPVSVVRCQLSSLCQVSVISNRNQRMTGNGPRTTSLPFSGLDHLAHLALDGVALQHAQVLDEEDAVQVVDLMAEGASEQSLARRRELLAANVLRADRRARGASGVGAKIRQAQAALFLRLLAFRRNDLRIHERQLRLRLLPD